METHINAIYLYFKQESPSSLILFHLPGRYVALNDDAGKVRGSLNAMAVFESAAYVSIAIPEDRIVEAMGKLADNGHMIKVVDYRNDQNELDFPDIKRIEEEKSEDI